MRILILTGSFIISAMVSIGDVLSQYVPEITILIVIPILICTYYMGFYSGLFIAAAAVISELTAHYYLEPDVHNLDLLSNVVPHFIVYVLIAALIDKLVKQIRKITSLEEQRNYDLELAKRVHRSIFSPVPSSYGNLTIGSKAIFARELGGDYFYFTAIGDQLFFFIADISGKSIAAALFASLLHQSVNEALEHNLDLSVLVEKVNTRMGSALPEDMFVTMFCASFDKEKMTYANAGHLPPLLYSKQKQTAKMLTSSSALPIGIQPGLTIASATEPFLPGDVLLSTTDGITESPAFRGEPYEKLRQLLFANIDTSAQIIADAVWSKAVPNNLERPLDDAIVVCVKSQGDQKP